MWNCVVTRNMNGSYTFSGRIRRLKRTVPFTFRRLEGGLEGGASRGASSPSQGGLKEASPLWSLQGLEGGFKEAWEGLQGGFKGAWRGLGKGVKGASRGLEKGFKGASRGGLRRAWRGLEKGLNGALRWRGLQGGLVGASRGFEQGSKGAWERLETAWEVFEKVTWLLAPQTDHLRLQYSLAPPSLLFI